MQMSYFYLYISKFLENNITIKIKEFKVGEYKSRFLCKILFPKYQNPKMGGLRVET